MNHDIAFAKKRGTGFNLAIGEPYCLQSILAARLEIPRLAAREEDLQYPELGGHPELLEQLRARYPGMHVVVANGAKQALEAALHYYATSMPGGVALGAVYAKRPYWPSFETLARNQLLTFIRDEESLPNYHPEDVCRILTAPGNPCGWDYERAKHTQIWDAAYASPLYGWRWKEPFTWEVKVESASKMLGVSGLRVGWLVTENPQLAERAAMFVESTTSGVSNLSQRLVARMLSTDLSVSTETAAQVINMNHFTLQEGLYGLKIVERFAPEGLGMFAWFQIRVDAQPAFERALKKADVHMLRGSVFGQREPGWYRASLGLAPRDMANAVEALTRSFT